MHVAIVGAGALGRIYGVRLAEDGTDVSFVVRAARLGDKTPFVLERVGGLRGPETLERPRRVAAVPRDATSILVMVRFDQLEADDAIVGLLKKAPPVPIAVLTPLLPSQAEGLARALSRPLTPAMPGVVGYVDERGVVRYWVPLFAPTLFEEPDAARSYAHGMLSALDTRSALAALAGRLTRAGLRSHLSTDVAPINAATTASFFPLIAAIDVGGGVDGVLRDPDLLDTVRGAVVECVELAHAIGKPAPWARLLGRLTTPFLLRSGVSLGRWLAPETLRFVEEHFGAKLHEQHRAMAEALLRLGGHDGQEMPALRELLRRLG